MLHRIIQGDVMDGLRTLPDGCVQCTVTSPPYFGLRNYGVDGQIGLEETPEQFIQKMVEVFREVRRVTRDDGILWLNLGDSYSGSMSTKGAVVNQNSISAGTGQDVGYRDKPMGIVNGYKAKDLMGIPWRVAFALQADGWYFRSAIPWIKRNCMPESTTDRPTSAIEYIFLMAKSAKYFYDGEAIRCPVSGGTHSRGEYKEPPKTAAPGQGIKQNSSWVKACWAQPPGTGKKKPNKQDQTGNPTYTGFNERWNAKNLKDKGQNAHSMHIKRANGEPEVGDGATRNYRNSDPFFESWQGLYSESDNPLAFIINPQARPELHFATFPDLLAATCIKAGTSEYGCCPKCGAPWKRIVEATGGTVGQSWSPHLNDPETGNTMSDELRAKTLDGTYRREFKGWKPGCKCRESERVPCVVLDPFMGSGTVAVVARELNRSSIGCELNPEYVKIIRKRLKADSQLDTGVVSYQFDEVSS